MGLALEVGVLADLKGTDDEESVSTLHNEQFEIINKALRADGLGEHIEPQEPSETFSCGMFGYSGLHYPRRIAAHLALGKPIPPPGDQHADKDPLLYGEYWQRFEAGERLKFQHLIVHNDAEGYYVPVDFERPRDLTEFQLTGGWGGSTQRLHAECNDLARALNMPVEMDHESDEIWDLLKTQGQGQLRWQQYGIETFTCLRLLAASEVSLRAGAAIVFT